MPATLQAIKAASYAKAAVNSIIGELGEPITLMRAITSQRISLTPIPDNDKDSDLKKSLDAFDFANQREDQETSLQAPETIKVVRSKIKEALEALDDAGIVTELPESVTSQMLLAREQDIPANSVFEWYDWAITHAAPEKLLLQKIDSEPDPWTAFTDGYTPEEIATALDNIENRFFAVKTSLHSLFADYGIMKKVNMFLVDKDAINDPPVAMFYYTVPWEEPEL